MCGSEGPSVLHVGDGRALVESALEEAGQSLDGVTVRSVEMPAEARDRLADADCLVCGAESTEGALRALLSETDRRPEVPSLLVTPSESAAQTALEAGATDVFVRRDGTDEAVLLAGRLETLVAGAGSRRTPPNPGASDGDSPAGTTFFEGIQAALQATDPGSEDRLVRLLGLGTETLGAAAGRLVRVEAEAGRTTVVTAAGTERGDAPPPPGSESFHRRAAESDGPVTAAPAEVEGGSGRRTGAGVVVDGEPWGTVCFDSIPKAGSLGAFERAVVGLLSEWTSVSLERRRSRAELQRHERILETLGDPVYAVDTDGNYTYVNGAFVEHTGYTREEVIGAHVSKVLPEAEVSRGREVIQRLLSSGDERTATWEMTRVTVDGERVATENHVSLLRTDDGEFHGTVGVIRDISGRKQDKAELRHQRDRFAAVFDAAPQPFVHVRFQDGRPVVLRINEAFESVFGLSESEVVGTDLDDHIVPDEAAATADEINTLARDGESVERELTRETADGEQREFLFSSAALDDGFDLREGIGTYVDITDRKRRMEQLERRTQAIDEAPVGITISDPDREDNPLIYANDAFVEMTGYGREEALGDNCRYLQGEATDPDRVAEIRAAIDAEEPVAVDIRNYRKDGSEFWNHLEVAPVRDDAGEVVNYVGFQQDVTDRRHRQQRLAVLQRVLRHDLRNNMNEILLAVRLIERAVADEGVREQTAAIERTVEETLSLSRNVKGMQELFEDRTAVDEVVDLVERVQSHVSTLRAERPAVEVSVDAPATAHVVANKLIDRAIRNVLQNAVEHNDTEQPSLDVSVRHRPETGDVALTVSDDGPGVPDDVLDVLDSGRETQHSHLEGTGLWIVHWVVSISGGDLEVTEADPRGAAVTLSLPAAEGV